MNGLTVALFTEYASCFNPRIPPNAWKPPATPGFSSRTAAGVVCAPDLMVNCGRVIRVAEVLFGADVARAREQEMKVHQKGFGVFESAKIAKITPVAAAEAKA